MVGKTMERKRTGVGVQNHGIGEELVWALVEEHKADRLGVLERLWDYYRNDLDFGAGDEHRLYRVAQEEGLPRRLSGRRGGPGLGVGERDGRREIVIDNDIAWRVHTLVDYMFGKRLKIESLAKNRDRAEQIESVIWSVLEANGGMCFLQELALLDSVYGFVDVLVRAEGAL